MRRSIAVCSIVSLAALAACKEKKPSEAKPATKAVAATKDARPAPVPIDPAKRAAYREHLAAGRQLARAGKWRDAAAEFAAALEAIPMDGRGLSELGWASFQAGDFDRARDANRKSVLASSDPSVKAASLYNLGRIAEATGAGADAAGHYRASLRLRDNATVRERLAKLGEPAFAGWKIDAGALPCREPQTIEALCACLEKARAADYPGGGFSCDHEADADEGFGIIRSHHGVGDVYVQVIGHSAAGWSVAAVLEYVYNPGAFGIYEELGQDLLVERRRFGDVEVLWIEVIKFRVDRDMGVNEIESVETTKLTICRLGGKTGVDCLFHAPIAETYERDKTEFPDDPGIEHTAGLPIRRAGKLAATLAAGGTLTVTLAEGQKTSWLAPYVGEHQLW